MKTLLLCGAALCAVSAAYPAFAADDSAIQLSLGGYFKGYVSYVDQDEAAGQGVRSVDILRQTEVHFDGKTTLNNGLTVAAHIEGQADGGDNFFLDESYVSGSGSWGKVNFGRTYGTPYILQVVAPAADSNIDGRLQLMQPVNYTAAGISGVSSTNPETDYDQDVSAKVDKVSYITPIFSGFQGGVSFTPTGDTSSRALAGNSVDDPALSDIYEGAVRYENKIDTTTSYRVGAGYTKAQSEGTTDDNRQAWNAGVDFDLGAFGVGAAYQEDDLGASEGQAKYMVVGADYTMGSMVYGASYYNKKDDTGSNDLDLDRYSVGATYKVIPGLSFRGSVGYYDVSDADSSANATAVLLGTDIKF